MIPEPDYSDSEEEENRQGRANCGPPRPPISADGLILPRKLTNPCQESADRRQLHRELTFNQKTSVCASEHWEMSVRVSDPWENVSARLRFNKV